MHYRISTLIERPEEIRERYGDLAVCVYVPCFDFHMPDVRPLAVDVKNVTDNGQGGIRLTPAVKRAVIVAGNPEKRETVAYAEPFLTESAGE